ncbi:MAG: outer membrane homotrimeric porin [Desulfovermiculus sp.]|nr:outer membrane homotrimeric porin [Desulfovermiculus sp.]
MKKLLVGAFAAMFLLCSAAQVMAVELSSYGYMRITGQWLDNGYFVEKGESTPNDFAIAQRARTYFDFTVNENLKATVGLEWDSDWGSKEDTSPGVGPDFRNSGLVLGGDQNMIETKHLYLDFTFPGTQVAVRGGQYWVELPSNLGSSILGGDMPALSINLPINDQSSLTVGWTRPYDLGAFGSGLTGDEQDILFASLPLGADGFSITPFGAYGFMGDGSTFAAEGQSIGYAGATSLGYAGTSMAPFGDDVDAYWLGLSGDMSMMDPFVLKYDVNYGNMEGDDAETSGWYADLIAELNMDMMTPQLYGFYGSGDDYDDVANDDEGGRMPVYFTESFSPTALAHAGCCVAGTVRDGQFSYHGAGLWSVGFALRNIKFSDKISAMAQIAYSEGTNDKEMASIYGSPYNNQLTDEDSSIEFGGELQYYLYENLRAVAEAGYIALDMDEDVWGTDYEDMSRVALSLDYSW